MSLERNPLQEFEEEINALESSGAWLGNVILFRPNHKNSKPEEIQFTLVKISNQVSYSLSDEPYEEVERLLSLGYDFRDLELEFLQELWMEILPEL